MKARKLRMAMVGGGPGAFIGSIHRMAAQLDGHIELVAGAFSSDPEKSRSMGVELGLDPARVYGSYKEMLRTEAGLLPAERIDLVSIVTPNHVHFEPAKMALEIGFNVVLDKPMTFTLDEAVQLKDIADRSGKYFCLTHTYAGYPMIKEARYQIQRGALGKVRKVLVEYPQGWLSDPLEDQGHRQAGWRTDPAKSGLAGAVGDIGTHAFHLAEYVTGLRVMQLCAQVNTVVDGRKLDDDAAILLQFNNGASGVLIATQVANGEENNLKLRVYGEKGGLEWQHADCNSLLVKWPDRPMEILRAGSSYLSTLAKHNCRTPAGHPEGYIEAFANLYRDLALCIKASLANEQPQPEWLDFPGVDDGLRGMLFVEKTILSGKNTAKWTALEV